MTSSPCIHPVSVWGKKAFLGPSASREDVITRYKNKKDVISLQSAGVKSSGQAGFNTERHIDTKIVFLLTPGGVDKCQWSLQLAGVSGVLYFQI